MRASGNGRPEVCALNLLRIVRGEVPYERVKGRSAELIDRPNVEAEALADARWLLNTYEPRVNTDDIKSVTIDALEGNFQTIATISAKGDD